MSRPRVVVAATAVAMLVLAAVTLGPGLLRDRRVVAATVTPAPIGQVTPVPVRAGQEVCVSDVLLSPRTQEADLLLAARPRETPRLAVRIEGPGFRSPVARAELEPRDQRRLTIALAAPDRELYGRLCARNEGRRAVSLVGTQEFRTSTRAKTTIDGTEEPTDVALTFFEAGTTTVLADLPDIVERATVFRGFLGQVWLLWLLLVVVCVAVPLGVLRVLHLALEADRAERGG